MLPLPLVPLELLAVDAALLELDVVGLELVAAVDDDELPEEDDEVDALPLELLELVDGVPVLELVEVLAVAEPELAPCPVDAAPELVPSGGQRVTSKPWGAQ